MLTWGSVVVIRAIFPIYFNGSSVNKHQIDDVEQKIVNCVKSL